ncbi:hypothetical protein LSH36_681g00011 [Paralvinella palmiformis]|uniref:Fibronectin type-III domain-containing protein n=1 Tax=Paralvinella palmiformis TaxID=53620 RepID=A0AAD9J3Q3_9ANNE|nr:hypothetical protein LSH36_681g00011 [Paralvinella palmiformis]
MNTASPLFIGIPNKERRYSYFGAVRRKAVRIRVVAGTYLVSGLVYPANSLPGGGEANGLSLVEVAPEGDPLEPEFKSCVVENWEHLRCMWTPTREEQLKYTLTTKTYQNFTYSFVYSRVSNGEVEPQQRCQCALNTAFCNKEHSLNETCVLDIVGDLNGFDMGGIYSLNIHARTDHSDQEVMSWRQQFGSYFNTSERVKPHPIENMTYDNATGVLSWKRPASMWTKAETWSLLYNVTYRTQWNKTAATFTTTKNEVSLSVPYVEYYVNVSVKPYYKGYWSDVSSISYQVQAVAPVVNPETSVISYEYDPVCSSHCRVLIRWQPVKSYEQYGPNLQYVVLHRNVPSQRHRRQINRDPNDNRVAKTLLDQSAKDWVIIKLVDGYNNSYTELDVIDDMEVAIVTRNTKGQNRITGNSIFVKRKDHVLVLAEVLIVEGFDEKPNNILVSFEDKPRDASNVSYVLFWHDKNKKDPVSWCPLSTENGTLTWNISLERDYKAYRYGLGKVHEQANSGIQWSTKPVFAYGGLAEPPSEIQVTSLGANSVTLHWNAPVIHPGDGHVIYYDIQFCSWSNDTHLCTEDHIKSKRIPGTQISLTLNKLSHSTQYLINITSMTRAGRSVNVHSVYITTNLGLTAGHIAGIAVVALVLAALITVGGYIWWRRCIKAKKWYNSGVKVQVPEEQKLGADSVSSETPFLPTMYHQDGDPYNRSISINSMDSGLSLDDVISHEDMYSYVRNGYISSPTPLRSIPEDADIDEVFRSGVSPRGCDGFVHTYKVKGGTTPPIQDGYLANSTGNSQPRSQDQSRSGISRYAAVAIDGQSDVEVAEKYDAVSFRTGLNEVRLGSDDGTPSPEGACTYTQIQADQKAAKRSQNPFTRAFWNANRAKVPPQGYHSNHCPTIDCGKSTRRMPRYGKHRSLDGSIKRKAPLGYVANDGTFDPSAAVKVPLDYVANDGTFDPSNALKVRTDYVVNDGTFDPVAASRASTNYVANDGTFDPSVASRAATEYVANDGTFDPSVASRAPTNYVANDGTFDPSVAPRVPTDYVANDGTFDPSMASRPSTDYVANDGTFTPSVASRPSTDYVANDGTFDPSTTSKVPMGYVTNDGSFDPSRSTLGSPSGIPTKGPTTERSTVRTKADHSGSSQSGVDSRDVNSNECESSPSVCTGAVLSDNNNSGYVPHGMAFVGSTDSLNHRLSAVGGDHADDDCFDLLEPRRQTADDRSHVSRERRGDSNAQKTGTFKVPDSDSAGSAGGPSDNSGESNLSIARQGCGIQTADNCPLPQVCRSGDAPSVHSPGLRTRPGRGNRVLSSGSEQSVAHSAGPSPAHGKSTPGYVNIDPDSCDTVNCNIPTTLASVSRQCGGFVKEVKPSAGDHSPLDGVHLDEQNGIAASTTTTDDWTASKDDHKLASSSSTDDVDGTRRDEGFDEDVLSRAGERSHNNKDDVNDDDVASALKRNGVLTCLGNGYVKPSSGALDSIHGLAANGMTVVCGSGCGKDVRGFGDRESAAPEQQQPRPENNNILKADFCRTSAIVNGLQQATAAEPLV